MPLNNPLTYKWVAEAGATWAPIVQNTWYQVDGADGFRGIIKFFGLAVNQTNTGADAEDLEARITIENNDPMVLAIAGSLSGADHTVCLNPFTSVLEDQAADDYFFMRGEATSLPLECSHILIEVRQTSPVGVDPTLNVRWSLSRKEV